MLSQKGKIFKRSIAPGFLIALLWVLTIELWHAIIQVTMDAGVWSGPNDLYLNQYRPFAAALWRIFTSGFTLCVIGVILTAAMVIPGIIGWKDENIKVALFVLCSGIAFIAICSFLLLMMPLVHIIG